MMNYVLSYHNTSNYVRIICVYTKCFYTYYTSMYMYMYKGYCTPVKQPTENTDQ